MKKTILLFVLFTCIGCTSPIYSKENNYDMAGALNRLVQSVDWAFSSGAVNSDMTSKQILEIATSHDKTLLQHFGNNQIHVARKDGTTILLLCDDKSEKALVEDASCTGAVDDLAFEGQLRPCEFSLNVRSVCAGAN